MIAADSPSAFLDDGPTTTFVRQVLGAVAELDKAMMVQSRNHDVLLDVSTVPDGTAEGGNRTAFARAADA
jgi:hypothetical protein